MSITLEEVRFDGVPVSEKSKIELSKQIIDVLLGSREGVITEA